MYNKQRKYTKKKERLLNIKLRKTEKRPIKTHDGYEPIYTIIEPVNPAHRILNFDGLRSILSRYNFQECNQFKCMSRKPAFVWLNYDEHSMHSLKRKYYNTPIYLQNSLANLDSIDDKDRLHMDMKTRFPTIYNKYMAHSQILIPSWNPYGKSQIKRNMRIYIARPVNVLKEKREIGLQGKGYGGKDIVIIHDKSSLQTAKNLLEKYEDVLISDYIMNPLLFQERKFHIRVWFLASIINGEFSAYMLDFGRILTAKLPYQHGDWSNQDIHDTHLKSSDKDWFFPDDFTNTNITTLDMDKPEMVNSKLINDIFQQIRVILKSVAELLAETVGLYDNIKNGFNFFGVDLMIKTDSRDDSGSGSTVVLIECNAEGTYKTKEPTTHKKLENILFSWIDKVILAQLFKHTRIESDKRDNRDNQIIISDGKNKYHSYKLFSKRLSKK